MAEELSLAFIRSHYISLNLSQGQQIFMLPFINKNPTPVCHSSTVLKMDTCPFLHYWSYAMGIKKKKTLTRKKYNLMGISWIKAARLGTH